MDIFKKIYLEILSESTTLTSFLDLNPKDYISSNNNFPENGNDLDITNDFNFSKDIIIKISAHCINSNNEHGLNYIHLNKQQEIKCIKDSIVKLLNDYSIEDLKKLNKRRFFLKCINKKSKETFKLVLESIFHNKKIEIRFITFFKSKNFFDGTASKNRYIKQYNLGEIYFENITNLIYLGEVYF